MKIFILAVVLICTATAEGLAQQGEVKGTLSTPAGTPVEGYPVIISGAGQSGEPTNWISSTNSMGEFLVEQLPPGVYTAAPANEPEAATSFEIKADKGDAPNDSADVEVQVTPGDKF